MSEPENALAEEYAAAFQEYLVAADEGALQRAYELGHDALSQGLRMLDLAAVHHETLANVLRGAASPEESARTATMAADFLMASLSPFEMTHRGFLDANATLRRLNQELQQRVHEVQEADRRKDEFLAMLAHELRNPLGAVSNALQVLQVSDPGEPAWQRAMCVLDRQVRHQTRLVDELLDVSRIMRGWIQLHPERLDLVQLVRETSEDHRSELTQNGLVISLELPDAPVWVKGDPIRLAQVLGNLLQNSAKFTDRGGEVTLQVGVGGHLAVVTVRDTGIGIAPEMLGRVFDTFAQADRSLHRTAGGLGLGLALVKGLVELHGGVVSARSAGLGCGSEFAFHLPMQSDTAASLDVPPASSETPAAASLRILVIDDDRDIVQCMRDLLELCGHTVAVAYTGPTSIETARQFHPDLVLCDIGLPEMDGYAVAAALRQDPITGSARLLAISGYGQQEDLRRSREVGFDQHLTKPIDFAELEQLLAAMPRG
jgi:signal transduction histidine kinase